MEVIRKCIMCHKNVHIEVDKESIDDFMAGMHIQDAMPELTPGEREMFLSGICSECFDEMFMDEDDDYE